MKYNVENKTRLCYREISKRGAKQLNSYCAAKTNVDAPEYFETLSFRR